MKSFTQRLERGLCALAVLVPIVVLQPAHAAGTAAGTTISNQATVNYSVGGVAQTPIGSSPTGNSSGAGTATTFLVDNKVNLTVTEATGGPTTPVTPGQLNVVTTYKLTNTGNAPQAYGLASANAANGTTLTGGAGFGADNLDMNNLRVFVSKAACSGASATPAYNAATDTATSITSLAADACSYVFVVADTPAAAANGNFAAVRLTAVTDVNNQPGTPIAQTVGADTAGVDVVFADAVGVNDNTAARDGAVSTLGEYAIVSAALSIAKTSTVKSDPFNAAVNPKAIPGAVVEYAITLTNTGTSAATGVVLTDPIPANTTFLAAAYGAGKDVQLQVGAAAPTTCVAEAGADTNGDGCFISGTNGLTVQTPALGSVAVGAGNAVTVSFRVTVN